MKHSYRYLEKLIARGGRADIRTRWDYGRTVLGDPAKMASHKSLRHGAGETLIAEAEAVGAKLSEIEIRRRIQCARAYPTEGEIDHAVIDFTTWHDLIEAGFPPVRLVFSAEEIDALHEEAAAENEARSRTGHADQGYLELGIFPAVVREKALAEHTVATLEDWQEICWDLHRGYERTLTERDAHLAHLREACESHGLDPAEVDYPKACRLAGYDEAPDPTPDDGDEDTPGGDPA